MFGFWLGCFVWVWFSWYVFVCVVGGCIWWFGCCRGVVSWVVKGCVCIDVAGGASLVLIRSLV